jgi:hypothetical protein
MGMLKKLEAVVGSWVTGMVDDGKGGVWVEGKVSWPNLLFCVDLPGALGVTGGGS